MTDLDPCLLGCDNALAEADLLIALLSAQPESVGLEFDALRQRIARLRREVDRLRGMPGVPPRRDSPPDRIEFDQDAPWPGRPGGTAARP